MAYGLDIVSALPLGAAAVVAMTVITGHAPIAAKALEITIAVALGGVLGLGKWPLDGHGDKLHLWIRRGFEYFQRSHEGSLFEKERGGQA